MVTVLKFISQRSSAFLLPTGTVQHSRRSLVTGASRRTPLLASAAVSCIGNNRNPDRREVNNCGLSSLRGLSSKSFSTSSNLEKYYVKPNYLKKWGRRDMKRREMFNEYEIERASLRMIKKSDILPSGVRKKAADNLGELPLNSSLTRVRNRCVLTDRGRGLVGRFRVSRMMFRHFAERGQIAGVQKSQW